ncbi:MAG: hypothetical protein HQ492_07435 [Woeseiaceae bacterium]|nr:hypothetical protein [Woeseiaceae bacterium]
MISTAAGTPLALSETQQVTHKTGTFATKKIWLPKLLYDLLPFFYLLSGIAAFFATLYIGDWFWVLPHYLLFSAACLHMGLLVYRRRHVRLHDSPPTDQS